MSSWNKDIELAVKNSLALCVAVFSLDPPRLISGNKAFALLSGDHPVKSLRNPDMEKLTALAMAQKDTGEPIFEGMLTLGEDPKGYTTIQARILVRGNELLITGEVDLHRISRQNQAMLDLNREIGFLQRQLTKEKTVLESTLQKLKNANRQLTLLNEEKNRFLNMAAHDLRNPVSTAISCLDILINDKDSYSESEQEELLQIAQERLRFSIQLMTELLDVSKIETGSMALQLEKRNYLELVNKSVSFNRMVSAYKNIEIHTELPEKEIPLVFDIAKIEQVLNNLISNAIKYSHAGSSVLVKVEEQPDRVITSIIDRGLGIDADEIPLLFQPFQKTASRPTAGESSTGLGLAICKKIVEEHCGSIQVKSLKGQGSAFSFCLPADLTSNTPAGQVQTRACSGSWTAPNPKQKNKESD